MNRSIFTKAAAVATLSFVTAVSAGAQAPVNVLNVVGNARISSPGAGTGSPLFIDFLSGGFPPSTIGNGQPGTVFETVATGLFANNITPGQQGVLQDLQVNGTGTATTTNPTSAAATFMTIGGYTFTFGSAPAGTSGVFNFGPISLDQTATGTAATFSVLGTLTGPGFTAGTSYQAIFSTDFVGQSPADVFNSINNGGTPTVAFRASFTAPAPMSTVPEPSTYALLGTGLAGLLAAARRRRVQA